MPRFRPRNVDEIEMGALPPDPPVPEAAAVPTNTWWDTFYGFVSLLNNK